MSAEVVTRLTVLRSGGMPAILPPEKGQPCNRCGHCCMSGVCLLGQTALGLGEDAPGPCPLLRHSPVDYACGLIVDPDYAPFAVVASALLGVGRGCDAEFPEELAP